MTYLIAMMLAIDLGYLQVMLGAAALYGLAYLAFGKALWLGERVQEQSA